jgi:arylsulfatase A-like enzyme/Flp pilus assembly protein TadD
MPPGVNVFIRPAARFREAARRVFAFAFASMCAAAALATPPNLLLVTLDTTRADHLGAWGYAAARTPTLDALAARGARFARCDTAAPVTLPSHASILTGLFPPRHGVRDNGTFVLAPQTVTLAERLAGAGYDTAAVVAAVVLARRHGLDQGFRVYDDDLGAGYAQGTNVSERDAEATTAAALAALDRLKPPFFLWTHYYDPHEEYRPPTRFADALTGAHRLYDGEIAFVDEQLARLLARLPADTVIVVVGDHGEMLGEHGETTHGLLPLAGARRVPLILAGPGVPGGRVVDSLVRTVDVAPTLLAAAGLPAAAELDGRSLLPLDPAALAGRSSYCESFLPFFAYRWYPLRAVSDGEWLFLQAPRPSLYRLRGDPGESLDLAERERRAFHDQRARLDELLRLAGERLEAPFAAENVLSEEQRRELASLGYLGGGGGGTVSAALPDPRSRVGLATDLHRAAEDVQQGRCDTALPELQRIAREDAHNFPALNLAGQCLRDAGRPREALDFFRRAALENPLSAIPVANVAGCLLALGERDPAEREFRHALALDPTEPDSATNLARLRRERGDAAGARATLDRAIAAGALAAPLFLERGVVRAEGGDLAGALADFREATRRDPLNAVALEDAARAAYQLGTFRDAAALYESLARLTPARADVWKTLGAIYLYQLQARGDAERCFRRALAGESDPAEREELERLISDLSN